MDPYGWTAVWRSAETWRRRSSWVLVGLLVFVAYIMVALAVAGLGLEWTLGAGTLALVVGAVAAAEATYVIRPSQERLTRADRLIVIASGVWLGMGILSGLVLLAERLFP
jgi:hypothetical protein